MYVKQLTDENNEEFVPVAGTASTYNASGVSVDVLLEGVGQEIAQLEGLNGTNFLGIFETSAQAQTECQSKGYEVGWAMIGASISSLECYRVNPTTSVRIGNKTYDFTDFSEVKEQVSQLALKTNILSGNIIENIGYSFNTNGSKVQKTQNSTGTIGYIIPVEEGAKRTIIYAKGGGAARLWYFVDNNYNIIGDYAESLAVANNLTLTAPAGATMLIVNNTDTTKKAEFAGFGSVSYLEYLSYKEETDNKINSIYNKFENSFSVVSATGKMCTMPVKIKSGEKTIFKVSSNTSSLKQDGYYQLRTVLSGAETIIGRVSLDEYYEFIPSVDADNVRIVIDGSYIISNGSVEFTLLVGELNQLNKEVKELENSVSKSNESFEKSLSDIGVAKQKQFNVVTSATYQPNKVDCNIIAGSKIYITLVDKNGCLKTDGVYQVRYQTKTGESALSPFIKPNEKTAYVIPENAVSITVNTQSPYIAKDGVIAIDVKSGMFAETGGTTTIEKKMVVCWGDSLTAGDGVGVYPNELQTLLSGDYEVVNQGVGGEDVHTILGRLGSEAVCANSSFTLSGTKGTKVLIGDGTTGNYMKNLTTGGYFTPLLQNVSERINPVHVSGIECTITRESTASSRKQDNKWYIEPNVTTGINLSIPQNMPIIPVAPSKYRNPDVAIFWLGTNGGCTSSRDRDGVFVNNLTNDEIDYLVERINKATQYCGAKLSIVISPVWHKNTYLDQRLYQVFGNRFLNFRQYITTIGLYQNGITPTNSSDLNADQRANGVPSDVLCMSEGILPSTLYRRAYRDADDPYNDTHTKETSMDTHMNVTGNRILAKKIEELINELFSPLID